MAASIPSGLQSRSNLSTGWRKLTAAPFGGGRFF
jgi:hypothetical protein